MATLYFLRHELAGNREEWEEDDRLRPLTKKGEKRAVKSAKRLSKLNLDLDVIITSPLVRARQTAEMAANGLDLQKKLVEDERLSPGFDQEKLAAILKDHPEAQTVMLVGHEPDFSTTVEALIGGGEILFRKGGLARVDITEDEGNLQGQLVWLIPPKVLAL